MQITCPSCGNTCEVDGELAIGQHMVCPFCSEKFSYSDIEHGNEFCSSDETIHNGIAIKCPHCGTEYEVDEGADGAMFQCGVCDKDFVVNIRASGRGASALADRLKEEPVKNVSEVTRKLGNNIKIKDKAVTLWKRITKMNKSIVLISALCIVVIAQFFALMILLTRHGISGGVQTSVSSVSSLPPGTPSELLLKYAEEGEISYVEAVLKQNPALDVNRPRAAGNKTALYIACEKGYADIVKLLLGRNADTAISDTITPNIFSGASQFSPLTIAAKNGHLDVVKVLLSSGVDIESRDSRNRTALYAATAGNKPDVVRFLCESNAKVNINGVVDGENYTPLIGAAERGLTEVIKVLLKYGKGIDLEMRNKYDDTALYYAVNGNKPDIVRLLCESNAKVNTFCDGSRTPLSIAAGRGYTEVIRMLLKYGKGIDVRMSDKWGDTPLHLATKNNHSEAVEVLRKADADLKAFRGQSGNEAQEQKQAEMALQQIMQLMINEAANGQRTSPPAQSSWMEKDLEERKRRMRVYEDEMIRQKARQGETLY